MFDRANSELLYIEREYSLSIYPGSCLGEQCIAKQEIGEQGNELYVWSDYPSKKN